MNAVRPVFRANNEVAVLAPDLAKAEAFYGGVMGLERVSKAKDMLEYDAGALRLFIVHESGRLQSYTPSFDVTHAKAAREHLIEAGCKPVTPGEGGGHFEDPFGFVFDIIERS